MKTKHDGCAPLVKGGQGRSAENLIGDAVGFSTLVAALTTVLLVVVGVQLWR